MTQPSASEAILKLDAHFDHAPNSIEVHLPWFLRLDSVTVDGTSIKLSGVETANNSISIPPTARELRLRWTVKPGSAHLSYEKAVADYEAEYARRYEALMHGLDVQQKKELNFQPATAPTSFKP
jgi:hypothetical protein